jgi:hypothetical protein
MEKPVSVSNRIRGHRAWTRACARSPDYLLAQESADAITPVAVGAEVLPHLYVLDIQRNQGGDDLRLLIRLVGTALDLTFRRPLKGKYLEDFIHGPRAESVIQSFHHVANTKEPLWMSQIVRLKGGGARCVEGVVVYVAPERLYGGLLIGAAATPSADTSFERKVIARD